MADKDHILFEIRRLAELNDGRPLGRSRFFAETGISEPDWLGRYWARWSDALAEAGLRPNAMVGPTDEGEALAKLALETRHFGHLPTYAELRLRRRADQTLPGSGVYERLGPKPVLAARLLTYCAEQADLADVAEIVSDLLESDSTGTSALDPATEGLSEDGYVYLVRSGRHFKLGRTNSVGRREYELAVQLPERAVRVHAIKTDDPVGIESYWHDRFAERRKNGEWFELTPPEVKAFKRRKFM